MASLLKSNGVKFHLLCISISYDLLLLGDKSYYTISQWTGVIDKHLSRFPATHIQKAVIVEANAVGSSNATHG